MSARLQNQALALAGVAEFALYAHQLATAGRNDTARLKIARHAIFCTDPGRVIDVYGNMDALADGTAFLKRQFQGRNSRGDADDNAVAQYMGQLLRLAGRLYGNRQSQDELRGGIDRARLAAEDEMESILAESYQAVISPMKPRIMLRGHPSYLENPLLQARARTLLLAAIRCGVLWRQCGGGFSTLLLRRKALLNALNAAEATAPQVPD